MASSLHSLYGVRISLLSATQQALLIFELADQLAAFPLQDVERIVPMAALARPPGMPAILEGFLNLAGHSVPILRPDRLFRLPFHSAGLHSMVILLKAPPEGEVGLMVDRVREVRTISASALLPIVRGHFFNECCEASVMVDSRVVHLLSPGRIFLEKERELLREFHTFALERLAEWKVEAR